MVSAQHEIVSKVLDSLKTKVSDFNFKNWFRNLQWDYEPQGKVTVSVPSRFVRDWLVDHYLELIKFEFYRITDLEHKIQFKIDRKVQKTLDLFNQTAESATSEQGETCDLPAQKTESNQTALMQETPPKTETQVSEAMQRYEDFVTQMGFNPKYNFETYVVGNSNQLVHAACQAVARQPARSYNPLFIYGGVGLGKTHLLNAIGLEVLKQYRNHRIIYVTGEKFTNEVISAIRYGKAYELRKKYRENCDMLLIDDIQFIAGKERTMEEFFHTFNALYEARKQIVLTSDKMPKDIPNLEERLISRFGWGLMADIQSPDFETRMAILRKKAEEDGIDMPNDVCEYIAEHVSNNVRDLEGSLVRVSAFASLSQKPITFELAREILKNIVEDVKPKLSVEGIQSRVAEYYNLKISDLKSKRRHKNLALPRQIAMYLCKAHLECSFPELGQKFGGKDHTTVMHACQKIKKHLEANASLTSEVKEIEKGLGLAH